MSPEHCSQDMEIPVSDAVLFVPVLCVPWFPGCRIRNGENGVHFLLNRDGRRRGDALIELESKADVQRALEKHLRYMGPRYVKGAFGTAGVTLQGNSPGTENSLVSEEVQGWN